MQPGVGDRFMGPAGAIWTVDSINLKRGTVYVWVRKGDTVVRAKVFMEAFASGMLKKIR